MNSAAQQPDDQLDQALATILAARKYRCIHPGLARDVAAAELAKGRTLKEAVKAAKNQLHQSAAAYIRRNLNYDDALHELRTTVAAAKRGPDGDPSADPSVRALLRSLMAAHASTYERLPLLDTFYPELFQQLPPVRSVLDIACGLHPLARPWMPLSPDVQYFAFDIFADQMDFLNRFFDAMGYAGAAAQRNALDDKDTPPADIAFLLKTVPCLEQIERGAGERLLHRIDAPILIVSFPNQTLAGRKQGMAQHYATSFLSQIKKAGWQADSLTYTSELVYIVHKH
ncbi:MAG: 16S rRNA methyltransferase [Caldilineaceae bacterium SB0661_bin_32]|uniref:16S rRNA (guanine(1405)-N(7))-methyltransferase n=1 Tax=Caldilineaceae bacterium SB0661_bin_32 TaxID=2605255 RepID=A0A6B1D725_9CHLR|nr:16S rRNA methyltransferase [Caldilineaceae bacterium SB0661_bin_32]